ncbi:unnamed protein product, partial [marine sediment metagenome]
MESKSIHIDILICKNVDYIIKATADFTGLEFGEDLDHSIKIFQKWQEYIENKNWPGSINVKMSRKL